MVTWIMAKYRFEEFAINSTAKKKPVEEDKYTYLGLEHLDPRTLKVTRFGSEVAPIGEKLIMKKGDVLFGKRRAYQKKVAIAPFDGIFSAHGMVLRPNEELMDKDFFPLFISSDYFLDAAIKISVGSLSPTINWRDLKVLEFELPSLEEQRKLAKVLWGINDTMESYKKLIKITDELVKSQFIEQFGDPQTNSKGLNVIKGADAFVFASGKSNTIQNLNDTYEYLCYGGNGVTGHSKEYFCEDSTLAIGRVGEYCGSVHLTQPKSWITDNAIYIKKFKTDFFELEFLYYEFLLLDFHRFANTVGQPKITQAPLSALLYIVPSIDEQKQFIQFARQSNKLKFKLEQVLAELTATYKGIIAENLR